MAESKSRKKRIVKNPETFRERALKAGEAEQPKRVTRVRRASGRGVMVIFRPIGRGLAFIFNRKPFIWLRRPLHLLGLILAPRYVRNSWKELRLVTWPSWKQSRALTFAVLVFAVLFGAAIAGVDWGLDKLFRHILLK